MITDFIIVTNNKQSGVTGCYLSRFLRLRAVSSSNFSEKENRTTVHSLSVFQSIQFLNMTQLVASG